MPIVGANVTVFNYGTTNTSAIFSTNTSTITNNPLTTDSSGRYSFYAADGRYSLRFSGGSIQTTTLTDISLSDTVPNLSNLLAASSGSSLIGTIAAGMGAVARTEQDKFRKDVAISPEDYGAVGDGVTDDGTALTNFFSDLLTNTNLEGRMLSKIYASSIALPNINVSGFTLRGFGPAGSHDVGSSDLGTVIKAIAGNTGTMLTIAPTEGASAQYLSGIRMIGITFNCNSIADKGVITKSMRYCDLDFTVRNAVTTGWEMNVSTTLGEATDSQYNRIRYVGRQKEAAAGVSLRLKGSATANPSFNWFEFVDITHKDAQAIVEENADNNIWGDVRTFMAVGGAASSSIEWDGGASSGVSCRSELFLHISTNKAAVAKGTGSFTVGAQNIRIFSLDKGNSTPDPTVETGATAYWQNDSTPIYDTAWTAFTPTITAGAGTFTSVAGTGRYRRQGNIVYIQITVTITTNGTASSFISATLPVTAGASGFGVPQGYESSVTGKEVRGAVTSGSSSCVMQFYDGTYPGGDGRTILISGFYEV